MGGVTVLQFIASYVKEHSCFYSEELQSELKGNFPDAKKMSVSTICRSLKIDLNLTRKVLERHAREGIPGKNTYFAIRIYIALFLILFCFFVDEIRAYQQKLSYFYSYPEQMIFVDETSKDGRHALRRYAWSTRGQKATIELPFSRGKWLSVFAASNFQGNE